MSNSGMSRTHTHTSGTEHQAYGYATRPRDVRALGAVGSSGGDRAKKSVEFRTPIRGHGMYARAPCNREAHMAFPRNILPDPSQG